MSVDFKPHLVKDSRFNISDTVQFSVASGASSNTYQTFLATSASASNISFNVQVPSESIVLDRTVLLDMEINVVLNISNVPATEIAFEYGTDFCFQSFPLNSLFSTIQATINNSSVSSNIQDIKDALVCMLSPEELAKYQGGTPTQRDIYQQYSVSNQVNNDVFDGIQGSSLNSWFVPRGAYPLTSYTVVRSVAGVPTDNDVESTGLNNSWVISLSSRFVEPIFLSPFLFGGNYDYNNQGLVGISQFNLVCNVDSTLKRVASMRDKGYNVSISLAQQNPFGSPSLLCNFLTSQPTDLIKAKNSIQFYDMPRYITGISNTSPIPAGNTQTITCQNIQLNQIPDMFLIFARVPMSSQTIYNSASFLPITGISVNFNNSSGLLSTASAYELWRTSRRNGVQMSFLEWSGNASFSQQHQVGNLSAAPKNISTVGSLLVLNPAYDLSLPSYLSNGSLGQFSFQINVTVKNNYQDRTGAQVQIQPEVVIVCLNAGVFTTISGNSSVYTGLLTKEIVLNTSQSGEEYDRNEYERLVGGSLANRVGAVLKNLMPRRKMLNQSSSSSMPNRRMGSKLDSFT